MKTQMQKNRRLLLPLFLLAGTLFSCASHSDKTITLKHQVTIDESSTVIQSPILRLQVVDDTTCLSILNDSQVAFINYSTGRIIRLLEFPHEKIKKLFEENAQRLYPSRVYNFAEAGKPKIEFAPYTIDNLLYNAENQTIVVCYYLQVNHVKKEEQPPTTYIGYHPVILTYGINGEVQSKYLIATTIPGYPTYYPSFAHSFYLSDSNLFVGNLPKGFWETKDKAKLHSILQFKLNRNTGTYEFVKPLPVYFPNDIPSHWIFTGSFHLEQSTLYTCNQKKIFNLNNKGTVAFDGLLQDTVKEQITNFAYDDESAMLIYQSDLIDLKQTNHSALNVWDTQKKNLLASEIIFDATKGYGAACIYKNKILTAAMGKENYYLTTYEIEDKQ